jgi:predicted CXXCH cytochrome family protein
MNKGTIMKRFFTITMIWLFSGLTVLLSLSSLYAQPAGSIVATKHNMSVSGPGAIKALFETRICIFCHAPHHARTDISLLWNRQDSTITYTQYQSSTMYAAVGQPTGASKLCLSCHDGTIALGAVVSQTEEIVFAGGVRFFPDISTKLGTDLSDDHPISFVYDSSLALSNLELVQPLSLPSQLNLDNNQQLQCTTCHDPHDNTYGKFLVMNNASSALCTSCHIKNGWNSGSHSLSNAMWNGSASNPWPVSIYFTVAENGCTNCHAPHSAGGHERLLHYAFEEDNCNICHNGNVAGTDIAAEFTKPFKHAVQNYTGLHQPLEDVTSGSIPAHVECADCHNGHWSNANTSPGAPAVSGAIDGVSGVNTAGQFISVSANEYEICFKCHADNNVTSVISIDRQIQQLNTRLEFDISNPSFHPVTGQGVNIDVPSLIPPYTTASILFCTDCHNNDGLTGPKGPHGSNNEYLLEFNYTTQDNTIESSSSYALCYKCHDRNSILANESFSGHNSHIVTYQAPCSACHDAHGISSTEGNSLNNSHLINFDVTIVQPEQVGGSIRFDDTGTFSGQCSLFCHASNHNNRPYP